MNKNHYIGAFFGILAAVCYGTNPFGAVNLYHANWVPETVIIYRMALALIALAVTGTVLREKFRPSKKDLLTTASLGALFAASSGCFYTAFTLMDVGVASTILFIYPIITATIMVLFFKEKLRLTTVLSILLATGGIAYLSLSGGDHQVTAKGVWVMLVAASTYAVYIVVVDRAPCKLKIIPMTFWIILFCLASLVIWTALSIGSSAFHLPHSTAEWGYAGFLALVPTLLSLAFMNISAKRVGSTATAVLGALEPLTAVAIGVFIFHEAFTYQLAIGIIAILVAVGLILIPPKEPRK